MSILSKLFKLNTAASTLKGRKQRQEDAYYISPVKKHQQLIFVADGVGGHKHGEFASNLCVSVFDDAFKNQKSVRKIKDFIHKNVYIIAAKLLNKTEENEDYKSSGTTISGFFINQNQFYTFNIGDSRVYYYTGKSLIRVTKDHSIVQDLVDSGQITEDEAFDHPKRNMMTSAIGQKLNMIKLDIKGPYKIKNGEYLLAFSDGVHDALRDENIKEILAGGGTSKKLAKTIVDSAYLAGGKDNITACVYKHL